jgi:hypothetical protein
VDKYRNPLVAEGESIFTLVLLKYEFQDLKKKKKCFKKIWEMSTKIKPSTLINN